MVTKSRQLAVCKIQKFGNIKVTAAARCAETACRAGGAVTCWGAVLCRSPAFFVLRDILSQRRESIVETQKEARKGKGSKDMEKQALQRADARGILNAGFHIDPVEKGFNGLAQRTDSRGYCVT